MKKNLLLACSSFVAISLFSAGLFAQNNCLDFDGSNDYVTIPTQNLTGSSQLTMEAWIYADNVTTGTWHEIYRQNGSGIPSAFLLAFQNSGTILAFGINTSSGYLELDVPINANDYVGAWHHVAGVYDGANMTIYVDGSSIGTTPHAGTLLMNSPTTHRIGVNVSAEYFDGRIDEVRLWSVARTQSQIINDMDCAMSGPMSNLVAVYNLNEMSGTVAVDASGNGYDGTLVNGPVWVTSTVAVVCSGAGLNEGDENESVVVFPNPASNELIIDGEFDLQNVLIEIYDMAGAKLNDFHLNGNSINTSSLSTGVYSIHITGKGATIIKKFVKQ